MTCRPFALYCWLLAVILILPGSPVIAAFDPVLDPDVVSPPPDSIRVVVRDGGELQKALAVAAPGQVIELADGVYDAGTYFAVRKVSGTAEAPLIIRAQHQGRAEISGGSWFYVEDSSYVVIEGLLFTTVDTDNNFAVRLHRTHHSRVTRNSFALVENPANLSSRHWVYVGGTGADHNRIDHNYFEGKRRIGNFVSINGDNVQVGQYNRIDHNLFRDARSVNANGMEAIRIGTSDVSRSYAYTIIEYNLFAQCNGDAEIISVKSAGNHIRYNTFWECEGTLTLRHGNDNQVYGNYFLGNGKPLTGGVRVYGKGHAVYNNHFERLEGTGWRSALTLGSADVENQETILNYWRVEEVLVAFNTFVDNRSSIAIAPDANQPFAPKKAVIANNLIVSSLPEPLVSVGKPAEIIWIGNMVYTRGRSSSAGTYIGINLKPEEARLVDPQLQWSVAGVHFPGAGSPVIDAAELSYSSVIDTVIYTDIEGKSRHAHPDVGAFEYAGYPLLRGPLTEEEVGPNAPSVAAFSLSAPAVYITKADLHGTYYERTGWWGPLILEVETVTTGELDQDVLISVSVNDSRKEGEMRRTATGGRAEFRLNQGELGDGEHILTITAAAGGHMDTARLHLRIGNIHFSNLTNYAYVKGRVPLDVAVGIPPDQLQSVHVMLDDELIYDNVVAPSVLAVDTLPLAEGRHRLQAVATSIYGAQAVRSVDIEVDNKWEIVDNLQPPLDWGFFGLGIMERTLATVKWPGWLHQTERPEDFFGDADRLIPQSDAEVFLIWDTPRLTEALITLYSKDAAVVGQVECAVSADGSTWHDLPYQVVVAERSANGWMKLNLAATVPVPEVVEHFRLSMTGSGETYAGDTPGEKPQVGQVVLHGWY